LVLVANDGNSGFELWAVSAEGDNVRQIFNLAKGNTSTSLEQLTVVGDRLYFTANVGSGRKLYSITSAQPLEGQAPDIVKGAGDDPKDLTAIEDKLYFSAKSELGRELWVADGNSANLVEDINQGTGSSSPSNFTAIKNQRKGNIETQLFFTADGGERGVELWSLDLANNSSKPQRYDDIVDGPTSSEPRQLVNAEQRLYFTADDGVFGRELWTLGVTVQGPTGSSNGESSAVIQVEEGTKKVFQYNSNSDVKWSINGGDDADQFTIKKNGWLRFKDQPIFSTPVDLDQDNTYEVRIRATDQIIGSTTDQLLSVQVLDDGTNSALASAELVKNIRSGEQSSNPSEISTLSNGNMLFAADNGKKGIELWISQGTKPTTSLLMDINKGSESSNPSDVLANRTDVYFSANDGLVGQELWSSNGTAEGTVLLADINSGVSGSFPSDLLWLDQRLFFAADDGRHGRELWSYSTSDQSSSMVLDIQSQANTGSNPGELTEFSGQIIFAADDEIYGRELWMSDGTGSGTRLVEDLNPGGFSSNPSDFSLLNGRLYFTAESYLVNGRQIFKLENNTIETTAVLSLDNDNTANQPDDLHSSGNQLFYSAETIPAPPNENSSEESARDPGGFMDAADGISNDAIGYINDYNQRISEYRRSGDTFDIQASAGGAGFSANMLLDFENDASLARDWNQYFQPLTNDTPLQFSSNTPAIAASRSTTQSPGGNNQNLETLGRELWISNGETNGSTLLIDINPGTPSSNPSEFTTIGSNTYFSADDGVHGSELWVSDGTTAGTSLIVDINPGPRGSSPQWITDSNGGIYFSARRDNVGRELWRLEENEQRATRIISTDEGRSKLKALDGNADEFRFELAGQFGKRQADRITGFDQTDEDQLALGRDVFDGLTDIDLVTVTSKTQLSDQRDNNNTGLIYFEPKGKLYFNQNGDESGYGEDGGLFAILKGGPELSESAFRIL
jgi:ELWxxDGT repeat protein